MRTRTTTFTTVRSEGAILPADMLQRIASSDGNLDGLSPDAYHLVGERLNEAINRAWNQMLAAWHSFQIALDKQPPDDPATSITREKLLLPLFQTLGYGRLVGAGTIQIDDRSYPISHGWQHTPIHLVGYRIEIDRRTAGVAGAARSSPHSLLQEALNRSPQHLWGFVANGQRLRILRDNRSLTRQPFVEFDLEAMLAGEVYSDFVLLWLLCHQSRVEAEKPEECWLERWSRMADQEGTRALDRLRDGVQQTIEALGRGFLAHPTNRELRRQLEQGELATQDYYRQLLRLVYRLIFLFVAEDRDLLLDPAADPAARERYTRFYALSRLRLLAEKQRGTRHADMFQGLRLVLHHLGTPDGCPGLGLSALGGLFTPAPVPASSNGHAPNADLLTCDIANRDLLEAIRALAFIVDRHGLRLVDYRHMGAEELGSVYESLLELHSQINTAAATFALAKAGGSERKTTGSYYTPTSLITCLLDSALDPVIDAAVRQAGTNEKAQQALLALKICDPACGSGHFLIAAAHRIAKRLAALRTGDEEPSPEAQRSARRDVIGSCIYGVDINPMAVELCQVSLWIEALEPGKPLSFLDHHIQCGNSLLGATPALLHAGIPDEAFKPIEGDDKKVCSEYRKYNREYRKKQQTSMFVSAGQQPWERLGDLAHGMQAVEAIDDATMVGIQRKRERYAALVRSQDYLFGQLWADSWCAAFVWRKASGALPPLTEETFRQIERSPYHIDQHTRDEIQRLAAQYRFFHWHLAYPDVFRVATDEEPEHEQTGWSGGFDVVLGNPPWERIKLQEKEWFATRHPDIASAPNASTRRKLIDALKQSDPYLYAAFLEDRRSAEGESHLIRESGRYPLTGRGDVNTYSLFAETNRLILGGNGRVGCIVPSGIATDDTTKYFFQDLNETHTLVSLYDFENRKKLFPAVDSRMKFSLLTLSGPARPTQQGAEFVFFAHDTEELRDEWRRFTLSAADIALINPNTRTCPIFRSRRDAELTKAVYRRVPVLVNERTEANPWGIRFMTMFHMSGDSKLFQTAPGEGLLPLYEAKLMHQFTHRWATYDHGDSRDMHAAELADPGCTVTPRYWIDQAEVDNRLRDWPRGWLLGFRDICRSTDERTAIFSLLPRAGVGHKAPLAFLGQAEDVRLVAGFLANANSLIFDYVTRQKVGGTNLTYFILKQLPVLPPATYTDELLAFIVPRVLELTYTAWDVQPFAQDCGYNGPPFVWDEARRFLLRCELDALYFHLYGISRDDAAYILDTFPIVRRKDEAQHGEYRTRRVILEMYDEMSAGVAAYTTRIEPPPGDARAAHPASE